MVCLVALGFLALAGCSGGTKSNGAEAVVCDDTCQHKRGEKACDGSCAQGDQQACSGECGHHGMVAGENCQGKGDCASKKSAMLLQLNIVRKVKPECVSAFIASFQKCKQSTLKEPGCIDYTIYQSVEDSTVLFIAETWKNEVEHGKHGETEHLKTHLAEIKDMADPNAKGSFQKIYVCPKVNQQ